MELATALTSAGFTIKREDGGLRAYCCDDEALHDADLGGIFGPTRVYCSTCGGEIDDIPDDYTVVVRWEDAPTPEVSDTHE